VLNIIDVINISFDEFRKLLNEEKYNTLIKRKLKIIIKMVLLGHIKANQVYLIERIGEEPVENDIAKFVSSLDMQWCEMNKGGEFIQFKKDEAEDVLRTINPGEVVMLRDFVPTDYCGYVSWNADRDFLVEARKGGFYSFWEAKGVPTYYIIDKNNKVKQFAENACSEYSAYDYEKRHWYRVKDETPEKVVICKDELKQITDILVNVSRNYRKPRVAWIKNGDRIVVFDIWIMYNQGVLE